MRTLYLHIGTHRTATSSIQSFMHANSSALLQRGIFYPYKVARHNDLFRMIFSGKREVTDAAADLFKRADKRAGPDASVVLSDEDISMQTDLSRLKDFNEFFQVKVIFSLRRQDFWLESWFLQNIKWQWNETLSHCTLDAFLARRAEFHWVDYNTYVTHLEQVFGRENVLLYPFEKEQMPDGPVSAFARMIGLESITGLTPTPHVNSSHSAKVSEFMRCLPLDEAFPLYRRKLEQACSAVEKQLAMTGSEASSLLIGHDYRLAILSEYAEGNAALARRYFNRDQLFLAPVPGADQPVASMQLPADSYKLMRDFVEPFVRALIAQEVAAANAADEAAQESAQPPVAKPGSGRPAGFGNAGAGGGRGNKNKARPNAGRTQKAGVQR